MCNALTKCRIPLTVWRAACADVSRVSVFLKTHEEQHLIHGTQVVDTDFIEEPLQNHVETPILNAEDFPERFSLDYVENERTPSISPTSPVTTWRHCGVAIVSLRDTIDDTCTPPFMRLFFISLQSRDGMATA